MKLAKLLGIALVAAGVLALVYKGFSYTEETHKAKLGPLELAVKEKERVTIPTWAGVVAIAAGAALLLVPGKR
jgi:drug/metabolite transporter (DMT)-like permease